MEDEQVHFLVAGVQKGGTTTLFSYLEEHPQLQMATRKETHFFDHEGTAVDWDRPDYGVYHALFDPWDGRLRGEATPVYIYWPPSLARIRRYRPEMRLILLFRDPVARAWSHWQMEYERGLETMPFARAIREDRRRLLSHDHPKMPGYHRVFSYVERGMYGEQIERAYRLFPREQILPLLSQELNDDPQRVLGQVYRFLGVEDISAEQLHRRLNTARPFGYGRAIDAEDIRYLRAIFQKDTYLFGSLTGLDISAWIGGESSTLA
ncbi:sulfotransferase [Diaporthe sp. PMI_573]|nr:sulfotransferase [Diaporthaceae sp. PMI_573]